MIIRIRYSYREIIRPYMDTVISLVCGLKGQNNLSMGVHNSNRDPSLNRAIIFLALKCLSAVTEVEYQVIRSTVRGDRKDSGNEKVTQGRPMGLRI